MRMLLSFLLLLFIAGGNAFLAKKRGRDPVGWFLIGLLLGVFGLVILMALSKKKSCELELDEDRILAGIDDVEENFAVKAWFYLDAAHSQVGPVSFDDLRALCEKKTISVTTYVWCEGMDEWERLESMPVLQDALVPVSL